MRQAFGALGAALGVILDFAQGASRRPELSRVIHGRKVTREHVKARAQAEYNNPASSRQVRRKAEIRLSRIGASGPADRRKQHPARLARGSRSGPDRSWRCGMTGHRKKSTTGIAAAAPEAPAPAAVGANHPPAPGAGQSPTEGTNMPDGHVDHVVEDLDEEQLLMSADTLRGDIRDALLDRIKHLKKPWQQLSELEQTEVISGADKIARTLCRNAVKLVAAGGRTAVMAQVESINAKNGLKVTLTASRMDPHRLEMLDAVGQQVEIVLIDASNHDGEQDPAVAEPDQRRLPLPEGDKPVMDGTDHGAGDDGANAGADGLFSEGEE